MLKKLCIAVVILLFLCSGFAVFAAPAATVSMQYAVLSAEIAPEEETVDPSAPVMEQAPDPAEKDASSDSAVRIDDVYTSFMEEEEKSYGWIWAVVGGVVALIAAAVITPVLLLRKKK